MTTNDNGYVLVKAKLLNAWAREVSVQVQTRDNKLFYFRNWDGTYLGLAQGGDAAHAWMRGYLAAKGIVVGGSDPDPSQAPTWA